MMAAITRPSAPSCSNTAVSEDSRSRYCETGSGCSTFRACSLAASEPAMPERIRVTSGMPAAAQ